MKLSRHMIRQLGFKPDARASVQEALLKHVVQELPSSFVAADEKADLKEQLVLFSDDQIVVSPRKKYQKLVKTASVFIVSTLLSLPFAGGESELMRKTQSEPSVRSWLAQEIQKSQDSNCHLHITFKLDTGSVVEEQVNVRARNKSQCLGLAAKFKTTFITAEITNKTVVAQWGAPKAQLDGATAVPSFQLTTPYKITNEDCDCELRPIIDSPSDAFGTAMAPLLCGVDFDSRAWASRTPPVTGPHLPRGIARNYLLRFQKKGGFNPSEHLSILTSILASDLVDREPGRVLIAIQGLMFEHPELYEQLLSAYPKLQALSATPPWDCRSEEETRTIQTKVEDYVQRLIAKYEQGGSFETWKKLAPLSTLLARVPSARKQIYLNRMAAALAAKAAENELKYVPVTKIEKIAKHSLAPLFGEKEVPAREFFFVRDGKQLRPILLASEPIENPQSKELGTGGRSVNSIAANPTRFGFYSFEFPALEVKPDGMKEGSVQWKQKGNLLKAHYKVTPQQARPPLAVSESAPNYEKFWRDGTLTGLVVVGATLGATVETVVNQYVRYFYNRGFQFDTKEIAVADSKSFLRDKIMSDEADYLVKDSHIQVDDQAYWKVARTSVLKTGIKKNGGRSEVALLLIPKSNADLVTIEGSDMGLWMKKRSNQLLFVDAGCDSFAYLLDQVEKIGSPQLAPIAAQSCTTGFTDSTSNGLSLILSAVRLGSIYGEMRTALSLNEKATEGQVDRYVFPDEDLFKEKIVEPTTSSYTVQIEILEGQGR